MTSIGNLTKGTVSPQLSVPSSIPRPEYVGKREPTEGLGGNMYTDEEIERVRIAGRIAANAIVEAGKACIPGNSTDQIDKIAHEFLLDHNAYPSCLGYRGFPKSICTSVNEVICHGIPDSTVLQDGDIINLDITAYIGDMHGDTNYTFLVGDVDEESKLLVERTYEATTVSYTHLTLPTICSV